MENTNNETTIDSMGLVNTLVSFKDSTMTSTSAWDTVNSVSAAGTSDISSDEQGRDSGDSMTEREPLETETKLQFPVEVSVVRLHLHTAAS